MATIQKVSGIDFANISKFDGVDISAVGSINFIGKPATGNLLLDTSYGSGAEAAYSVRKLRTAYTGAAIQVQRTLGSFPTQEIGFDVNGNLDTSTLLAYASGTEVGVSIWYDQSLNGNNAVQTTVAQRPIVVAAGGALVEIDGRAAMNLDGSTDGFNITSNIQGAYSIFTIGNPGGNDRYYQDSTFGSRQYMIRNSSVAGSFSKYQNGTATSYLYGFTKELVEFISNAPTITYTNTLLMRYTDTGAYLGDFSEYIIYTSAKSGTNQTSIQENIGDYYTQNTPLLDTYSGAAAAYSLRKLRTDYTGFAIKVQDNVGGATQDIGFNVFGELDTVSLLQYAGSNDVFVETWYDQSGSGNNATQPSSGVRPQIVSSGAVIVENGKPAVQFSALFSLDMATRLTQVQSNFSVRENITTGASVDFLYGDISTYDYHAGGTNNYLDTLYSSTDVRNGSNFVNGQSQSFTTANTATTSSVLLSMIHLSNTARISQICQDRSRSNRSWNGKIQEILIYESDQSGTPQAGIETNINTFYDIYTPTPDPLLLNLYPGSAAAYSLRKLNANYTGSAILVQDTVGGATKAIGFDANGDLDTAELLAYAGSNDVLVETWFDQSGSGNNAEQISSSRRPKIVSSGAVIVDANGKPTVENVLIGAQGLNIPSFTINLSDFTCTLVSKFYADSSTEGYPIIINGDTSSGFDYRYKQFSIARDRFYLGTSTGQSFFNNVSYTSTNNLQLHTITPTNGYVDGTSAGTFGTAGEDLDLNPTFNYLTSGDIGRDRGTHANTSEVIIWTADKSIADRAGIEDNIGGYYDIPLPGLLDENPGAAAAYSLRRLSSTYTGSAIQVQRADNVGGTTDIGFDSYGDLDTTALTTAAAGNSMVVVTWYDQSGNSNDATQGTSTARPKIYDATTGVIVDDNGKPAVEFDGVSNELPTPTIFSDLGAGNAVSVFHISKCPDTTDGTVYNFSDSASNDFLSFGYNFTSGNYGSRRSSVSPVSNVFKGDSYDNTQSLFSQITTTRTNNDVFRNGVAATLTTTDGASRGSQSRNSIGTNGSYFFKGVAQEIITYASDESDNRLSIEENIGGYYDIPLPGLLDENPGAAAAYSLRRLRQAYTGSAIQVQRADNVGGTTDIGFDGYGDLDTAALTTAAAGNSMVVTTWFDQSGSGNNATQGTSANRPKIYDGTTGVIVENGKPAVDFDGGTDTLTHSSDIALAACSIFTTLTAVAATRVWYGETDQNYLATFSGNVTCKASGINRNAAHTPSGQTLYNYTRNGSVGGTWYKNSSPLTTTGAQTNQTLTLNSIGGFSSYKHAGPIQEIILYNSDQTDNRPSIEDNVGDYYGIEIAGLLDQYSGAAVAYSLRKLSNSYTGSAVRVQRADNVGGTTDIGFNADGGLDTDALTTAAAGNTMVVTTWFDQSGSGNDAVQNSTAGVRPKIYDGTTGVVLENGKPAVEFDGTNDVLLTGVDFLLRGTFSVAKATGTGSVFGSSGGAEFFRSLNSTQYHFRNNDSIKFTTDTTVQSLLYAANDTTSELAVNGAPAITSATLQTDGFDDFRIGNKSATSTEFLNGNLQEVVIYETNQSIIRAGIEANINFFYDIY